MAIAEAGEINLRQLFALVWAGRWTVVIVTAAVTGLAALASFIVPKRYEATIVLSPVAANATGGGLGGLSSLAPQLSGLAALAGISLGQDGGKAESVAVLQSETLTERYIREQNLLPVLFAKLWEPKTKTWKTDDPDDTPTLWKANQYFKRKVRRVSEDKKTGMVTMTISWKRPDLAAQWANDLVKLTNDYLRDKTVEEGERNIAYLKEEALKTDVVGVRTAIFAVLESQIKGVMLARGREEYALKVIDAAVAPERPVFPQPTLWIAGGFLLGAVGSVAYLLLRRAWLESA
jgi:uncharacterized protein involved in exopolysaccharide biosynthesis